MIKNNNITNTFFIFLKNYKIVKYNMYLAIHIITVLEN